MRVLMLGWEFPPLISGGLGTACFGLTRAMGKAGAHITFVLPRSRKGPVPLVRMGEDSGWSQLSDVAVTDDELELPGNVEMRRVGARLASPYARPSSGDQSQGRAPFLPALASLSRGPAEADAVCNSAPGSLYDVDLLGEVVRYADACRGVARREHFEVIHAHDWMTYPAAMALARQSGRPLVVHVHSTEFDRAGEGADPRICAIERRGILAADAVVCVSQLTRELIRSRYQAPMEKTCVIHNGIDLPEQPDGHARRSSNKVVLFLGRMTMQKGPEYFLAAARKVLGIMEDVRFVMAGTGDLLRQMIELAANLGIGNRVLFAGFLRGGDVTRAFQMADVYVMPSISEPFGITPLEAVGQGVPVIISKTSGVSEVLSHALKVDFWDVDEMANKIISVLKHPPLGETMSGHALGQIRSLTWAGAAARCLELYQMLVRQDRSSMASHRESGSAGVYRLHHEASASQACST